MENKITILAKISIKDNSIITDFQKTYRKRYNKKMSKSEVIESIIGFGIEKIKTQNQEMKNEIINYEKQ